ncbi:unnamed protein product [Brassica oleracea]
MNRGVLISLKTGTKLFIIARKIQPNGRSITRDEFLRVAFAKRSACPFSDLGKKKHEKKTNKEDKFLISCKIP